MSPATPEYFVPAVQFDAQLVRKLGQPGPSYTSYPTADRFSDAFGYRDYLQVVAGLRTRGGVKPLSIYLHIPFCETPLPQVECSRTASKNRDRTVTYLGYLKREIDMQGMLFSGINQVGQLYLGGASPACLSDSQIGALMTHLRRWFQLAPDSSGEYSIEADARLVPPARMHSLRRQGFNRLRLALRDDGVGAAAGQGRIDLRAIVEAARGAGFRSVGADLVYGLPNSTVMGLAGTLAGIIEARPDRIAVTDYAQAAPRRAAEANLPGLDARLDMLSVCIRRLSEAGYVQIGTGHFAQPADELAVAQRQGRLHRNFQGYSSQPDADLIACGVGATGALGATYSQNVRTLDAYYDLLDKNELPIGRGIKLGMDDALRRTVIQMLLCQFELSVGALEQTFPIVFSDYFAPELKKLEALAADGLLSIDPEWISVTARGRLLVRHICMVFDRHLGGR